MPKVRRKINDWRQEQKNIYRKQEIQTQVMLRQLNQEVKELAKNLNLLKRTEWQLYTQLSAENQTQLKPYNKDLLPPSKRLNIRLLEKAERAPNSSKITIRNVAHDDDYTFTQDGALLYYDMLQTIADYKLYTKFFEDRINLLQRMHPASDSTHTPEPSSASAYSQWEAYALSLVDPQNGNTPYPTGASAPTIFLTQNAANIALTAELPPDMVFDDSTIKGSGLDNFDLDDLDLKDLGSVNYTTSSSS